MCMYNHIFDSYITIFLIIIYFSIPICSVFVKQSFMKRTNNAIKYYEKLFPGCTIDLIGLGISYHKTLGDLTSDEMFQIFSHVHKLPHYKNSIFKNDH